MSVQEHDVLAERAEFWREWLAAKAWWARHAELTIAPDYEDSARQPVLELDTESRGRTWPGV